MAELVVRPKVQALLDSLENEAYSKALRFLTFLDRGRYELREPHTKKLTRNIYELRIPGKQEVRLLYGFKNGDIIVVSGFIKKTQKTPPVEIEKAEREYATLDI